MRTKNARSITVAEREHIARVKALPCSVCDEPGPSDAHHIKQGQHYTSVALCRSCHQGPRMGWHGGRTMWRIKKMGEVDALGSLAASAVAITLED